jgi:hypothetical protein
MVMLRTFNDDQVLAIWQAVTLLGDAGECCNAIERSEILADVETILMAVVLKLVEPAEKNANVYVFPAHTQ